jgi:hypothetical protein
MNTKLMMIDDICLLFSVLYLYLHCLNALFPVFLKALTVPFFIVLLVLLCTGGGKFLEKRVPAPLFPFLCPVFIKFLYTLRDKIQPYCKH